MSRFHIFTGPPTRTELNEDGATKRYQWRTVSSWTIPGNSGPWQTLPLATLASADRRISRLYENIIFADESSNEVERDLSRDDNELLTMGHAIEHTTAITWPPTAEESALAPQGPSKSAASFLRLSMSVSRIRSQVETQETQETGSYDYSDAESVARFPAFHFSLHRVTSLSALVHHAQNHHDHGGMLVNLKVTVLVAVLEVEGPEDIQVKKGKDAGNKVTLLKMVLGDEDGGLCKLTAWREVAEAWGGSCSDSSAPVVKRGDIVLLENVLVTKDPANPAMQSLTASPHLKSQMEICYRTMPRTPEDARYRPDLRLGISDSAVRKVAAVVEWFESMAGLH